MCPSVPFADGDESDKYKANAPLFDQKRILRKEKDS
jgi:hypothetical protein